MLYESEHVMRFQRDFSSLGGELRLIIMQVWR